MNCALAPRRHVEATSGLADVVGPAPVPDVGPGRWLRASVRSLLGRTAGWSLVVLGVVLMPLPGPGTLIVVAGLRVLVPHHRWAAASYDRVRDRAVAAARAGVATRPRVAASLFGVLWVIVLAGAYVVDVAIPRTTLLGLSVGPSLPFHGTATTVGLVVSALASVAATGYSIVALRPPLGPVARIS